MTTENGLFIAIEGIDGAGKTTQARRLAEALQAASERVILAKEPTDGPNGRRLRASAKDGRLPLDEELALFLADRQEHIRDVLRPELSAGAVIVLDRYYYSTLAYQGSRGGDLAELERRVMAGVIVPNVTLLIDLAPEIAAHRLVQRDGAINEFERLDDQRRIRARFLEIAQVRPEVILIDGTPPIESVWERIAKALLEGAIRAKRCAKSYGCDDEVQCGYRLTDTCAWARIYRAFAAAK